MCVSTVYVRNHYVADVLGGMATGTLGYVIGSWIMKARGAVATAKEGELHRSDRPLASLTTVGG